MPRKPPPSRPAADAEPGKEPELSTNGRPLKPVAPATKRFGVVVALFSVWLVFLIYLAFLTWSGK